MLDWYEEYRDRPTCSDLARQLDIWKSDLREELRTNKRGLMKSKHPKLADAVSSDFPNLDVLEAYCRPLTSGTSNDLPKIDWNLAPSLEKLAAFAERSFEWSARDSILTRFKSTVYLPVLLHSLRTAALARHRTQTDESDFVQSQSIPETELPFVSVVGERHHHSMSGIREMRAVLNCKLLIMEVDKGIQGQRLAFNKAVLTKDPALLSLTKDPTDYQPFDDSPFRAWILHSHIHHAMPDATHLQYTQRVKSPSKKTRQKSVNAPISNDQIPTPLRVFRALMPTGVRPEADDQCPIASPSKKAMQRHSTEELAVEAMEYGCRRLQLTSTKHSSKCQTTKGRGPYVASETKPTSNAVKCRARNSKADLGAFQRTSTVLNEVSDSDDQLQTLTPDTILKQVQSNAKSQQIILVDSDSEDGTDAISNNLIDQLVSLQISKPRSDSKPLNPKKTDLIQAEIHPDESDGDVVRIFV